jgi:hypothetical protein
MRIADFRKINLYINWICFGLAILFLLIIIFFQDTILANISGYIVFILMIIIGLTYLIGRIWRYYD